jgi:hypothetical protein
VCGLGTGMLATRCWPRMGPRWCVSAVLAASCGFAERFRVFFPRPEGFGIRFAAREWRMRSVTDWLAAQDATSWKDLKQDVATPQQRTP